MVVAITCGTPFWSAVCHQSSHQRQEQFAEQPVELEPRLVEEQPAVENVAAKVVGKAATTIVAAEVVGEEAESQDFRWWLSTRPLLRDHRYDQLTGGIEDDVDKRIQRAVLVRLLREAVGQHLSLPRVRHVLRVAPDNRVDGFAGFTYDLLHGVG